MVHIFSPPRQRPKFARLAVSTLALAMTLALAGCASAPPPDGIMNQAQMQLQAVLTEISRYMSVLVLIRVAGEISATVLVTAVLVRWIPPDWWAFLIAAVIMIVISYIIAAVIPRGIGRQRAVRVATL